MRFLNTLLTVVDDGDLFCGGFLSLLLLLVGRSAVQNRARLRQWGPRIGLVVFVSYCVSAWVRFGPPHTAIALTWNALRGLYAAALSIGTFWIIAPIVTFVYEHTIVAARRKADELAHHAARRAAERQAERDEREQQRRERERLKNLPPPPVPDPSVEAKKKSDAERRVNARFEVEALYRRHFKDVQEAYPPDVFAAFVQKYLSDAENPDVIDQRVRVFREHVLELAGGGAKRPNAKNPDELTAWYEREKEKLLKRTMDDTLRGTLLANLYKQYADKMDELYKEMQP